jgi:hypothetical protein
MSFLSLLDKQATIYHLAIYGGSGVSLLQEKWQSSGTNINCAIQPLDVQETALTEGSYGQGVKMFCDVTVDIKEGDKVVFDGIRYVVRGVQNFNFGRNAHKEVIMAEPEA